VNLLDIVLATIIGFCLIRGIFRGLVKELSSIIGVIAGFYAAYSYYPLVADLLKRWISDSGYANILSCLILFVGVYIGISILGALIKYLMNIVFLGWTDRICGLIFGTLKGVLIVSVIVVMLTAFLPKNAVMLKESIIVRHTMVISAAMVRVASVDMKKLFTDHVKELKQSWQRKKT
jgi:membrane protein required for colicin V production